MSSAPAKRLLVVPCAALLSAALVGCGASTPASTPTTSDSTIGAEAAYPSDPSRQFHASVAYEFESVGQLIASSDLVVLGTVRSVEVGPTHDFDREAGELSTTRLLTVDVSHVMFGSQDVKPQLTIRVADGFWVGGEGYQSQDLGWARVGDQAYFFVDAAEDSTSTERYYRLVSESGRVIIEPGHVHFAPTGIWDLLNPRDQSQVQREIARGVEAARSGTAKPLVVRVCKPSKPDDENSDPICTMEEA